MKKKFIEISYFSKWSEKECNIYRSFP